MGRNWLTRSVIGSTMRARIIIVTIILITLLCAWFTTNYVNHETPGYYWDYSLYSIWLDHITGLLRDGNWLQFMRTTGASLRSSEYNISPLLPLVPFSYVLGNSRLSYILCLVVLYLIPASLILTFIIQECWKQFGRGISFFLCLACVLLYPMFWAPTLRGYPDIAALIPMGLACLILLRTQWMLRISTSECLWLGLLLWCTFLLRRHYAYSVVAIILVTFVFAGCKILLSDASRKNLLRKLLLNMLVAAAALALPALIIQGPHIHKILTTSYQTIYSAYQLPLGEKLINIYAWNGPLWLLLISSGFLSSVYIKNTKVLYCMCIGVVNYILFQRTQAPDIHHALPFAFWMAPVAAWPLSLINSQAAVIRRNGFGAILLGLLAMVSLPSLAWSSLQSSPLFRWSQPFQAKQKFPPFRIKSYPALLRLAKELERPQYTNKTILVLASSYELNPSILENISPSLIPRIKGAGNVDLRDGFSLDTALNSDFIVATSKPALHLPQEHQQVIVIPVRALFDPTNPLAKSYARVPNKAYLLADGNTAYIFRRILPPSDEAISWLVAEFRKQYPSWQVNDGMLGPSLP